MRRVLAAIVLAISLWLGSLAWTGFLLSRTVLDPERSRDVAESLYDDESVRDQLASNMADAVEAALPTGAADRATIEAGATQALESPAVEAVFVDAFAQTHAAMLGEGEAPQSLDAGAVGAAARESLLSSRPDLEPFLPEAPQLTVPLPTEHVPDLGPVKDVVDAAVPVLSLLSAAGALLALGVSSNRPAVIRRAGIWAIGLAAMVLALAYGIPFLAQQFTPEQAEVVGALVSAMAETTRLPALVLGGLGLLGVVVSYLWRAAPALDGDPRSQRRRREPPLRSAARPPRRDVSRPVRAPSGPPPHRPAPASGDHTSVLRPPAPDGYRPGARSAEPPPTPRPPVSGGGVAPTMVEGAPAASPSPPPPTGGDDRPGRRWVEGVGWVLESSSDQIPAGARWVPGVGYVVDS